MRRIERVLASRRILADDPSSTGDGDLDESLFPFIQAASIQSKVALGPESGRPIPRLLDPALAVRSPHTVALVPDELLAESSGYSLHAATRIGAQDRDRLERLVAMVSHPREHQLTYFGVLEPASPLRDAVVPARPPTKRDP